jgi:hypothetical protein
MADHYDAGTPGGTNDTAAMQSALDLVKASGVRRLYFGPGDWAVTGQLDMAGHQGTIVYGSHRTRWLWKGNSSTPMLYLAGSRECEIRDLRMGPASASYPLLEAIRQEQDGLPGSGASSMNRFRQLHIEGLNVMEKAIYLKGSATDANNDFTTFDELYISGYDEAAVVLEGANCLNNQFRQCQLRGARNGHYGIKSVQGAGGQAGHFSIYGGALLGHLQADVYLETRCALPVLLDHVWSEGSERLFMTGGPGGAVSGIRLFGVQWASDQKSSTDPVIDIKLPGPVEINGCILGTDYNKAIRINWSYAPGYGAPSFQVRNTRVLGSLDTTAAIFPGIAPTTKQDSFWQTSDIRTGAL